MISVRYLRRWGRNLRYFCSNRGHVYVERKGAVATIVLNRPERKNAIDRATADLLSQKIREFENDSSILAGVLFGNGGFCSGADLKAIGDGKANRLEIDGDAPLGPSRFALKKPLIAAISGAAVAGGLELALLCDLRVMEEDAVFGVYCRRFGVPLIDGGSVRLPRLIGLSRAMDMILTGRSVYAEEALQFGLANRVVKTGTCRAEAEALAAMIASFPQACMLSDRHSAYNQHNYSISEAMKLEFVGGMQVIETEKLKDVSKFNDKSYKA